MRALIYSDLHLDGHTFAPVLADGSRADATADVVILAGDIDEGVQGFRWARETFDLPVLMVLGNHEYYGNHWDRLIDEARHQADKFNIDLLECDSVEIAGTRFLGCTLWTDFQLYGDKSAALFAAKSQMNDYKLIRISRTPELYWIKGRTLIPELTVRRLAASVEWLQQELDKPFAGKSVVVTHHAPHPRSITPRYQGKPLSPAYASDLSRLLGKSAMWVHGHVHDSCDYEIDGTRVVCNPRGYPSWKSEFENPDFRRDGIWEI